MIRFRRALLAAALLSLVAFIPAGPAGAEYMGIKIEVGDPTTFVYLGGDPEQQEGSAAICVAGDGVTVHFAFQPPTQGCPASVPAGTEIVSIPPSGGGGGGEPPPFPCSDQATCTALVEELIGGGGGGGGEEPPSGPAQRDCTGATGGAATCVDFGDGNFILGDPPDDGHGELGVCAGGSYFFVAGPDSPDGDAGGTCPAAASAPSGGEPAPAPEPDSDGDGLPDASDRCPTSAAGTSDGCPPQNPSGSSTSPTESSQTTGESQTDQERPAAPAEPAESPVLDITRNRLRVSRRGWVGIPLACRTTRTPCIGTLTLAASRRTKDGRRVRVVLARARVHVDAGDTATRRVRITRRGRELLSRRNPLRALARIALTHDAATVAAAERLTLRSVRR